MATRYWVLGSGTWDSSTITNWSTSSGGAGGASVPGSGDSVIFDQSSSVANAAYTVTMSGLPNCLDLTMDGPHPSDTNVVTWAGTGTLSIYGTVNLTGTSAGINRTGTFALQYLGTSTGKTWTSNGVAFNGSFLANGTGAGLTFNDSFNIGSANNFSLSAGGTIGSTIITIGSGTLTCGAFSCTNSSSFVLGANTISCTTFAFGNGSLNTFTVNGGTITASSNFTQTSGNINLGTGTTVNCTTFDVSNTTNAKVCTLGNANITCTTWQINSGAYQDTSTISSNYPRLIFSGASSTITVNSGGTFQGGGLDYGSVTMNGANPVVYSYNTFTSFSWTGTAANSNTLSFNNDQTISGNFTLNGNSNVNRALIKSSSIGVPMTISVGGTITTQYCDFIDITGTGAGSWNISASTGGAGDAGGNTGITFSTPVDQHWVGLGADKKWSTVGNWTSRIPLPQDNCFMDYAFGTSQTITSDMPRMGKTLDWTGCTWTTALTYTSALAQNIYGGWIGISGLTFTSNASTLTFLGRGSFNMKTNGTTIEQPVTIQSFGGTFTQTNDFTLGVTRTLTLSNGTWDTGSYVLSTGILIIGAGNATYPVTVKFNTGTHLITASSGTPLQTNGGGYMIIPRTAFTLKFTDTGATQIGISVVGYIGSLWFARGTSTATIQIQGTSPIFNDFKDTGTGTHIIQFSALNTFVFTTFTVVGTVGHLISLNSTTTGRVYTLMCKTGTINCDYISAKDALVGGGATWNAGTHSTISTGNYYGTGFGWADATNANKKRYWVAGGDGNWSSSNNWSLTSGGSSGAGAPNGEIVYFDANSGSGSVNIDSFNTYCGDLDCTGFGGKFTCISSANYLSPSGSVKFLAGMDWSLYICTTNKTIVTSTGTSRTLELQGFPAGISFSSFSSLHVLEGFTDTWTFASNYTTNYSVSHNGGIIDGGGYNLTMNDFSSTATSTLRTINLGTGTWTVTGTGSVWNVNGSCLTLNCSTSTVKLATTSATAKTFTGGVGMTYYNLWFDKVGSTTITDSSIFNNIKISPLITCIITFTPGTITAFNSLTINAKVGGSANHSFTSSGDLYYLRPLTGSFSVDYVNIGRAVVIGVGYLGTHSNVDLNLGYKNLFNAAPSTVVAGTVSNAGSGVSGAIVRLVRQEDNLEVGTTTTDGSGNYSFYADASKLYHVFVEYTSGGTKYNAKSLWNLTPV